MKEFIVDFIDRFGGRLAGSEEEARAQDYMEEKLWTYTDQVERHHFEDCLGAKFANLKLFCLLFYAALVLYPFFLEAALAIGLLNLWLFVFTFLKSRPWLDFLYRSKKSSNVIAILEPQREVRQTVIVSGHMDSVREFIWWYYLKTAGMVLTMLAGLLFVLLPLSFGLAATLKYITGEVPFWCDYLWYGLIALSPATLTYLKMHGSRIVDGAQDNLSALAVAYALFGHFAHPDQKGRSTLDHIRLKMISFGSEETGVRGSANYVKDHLEELKEEDPLVINMDGIRLKREIQLVRGEKVSGVKYSGNLVEKISEIFKEEEIDHRLISLPVGATDAAPFARHGLTSTTILGMITHTLDPTYHTRLDVAENVEEEALETVKRGLVRSIEIWDKDC